MPKTALVTGASSGMGEEIARTLHKLGYTVYAAARRTDRLEQLATTGIHALTMDVTDDESITSGIEKIITETGHIDVLINNAGYGSYGAIEDIPMDEARHQFEVNVFGLARLIQLVLPYMRAQRSGTIINISSVGGRLTNPLGGWYHASKHAVEALSDALRMETAPFGIDVVVIQPGGIRTEWPGITADHLEETAEGSAYAAQVEAVTGWMRSESTAKRLSPPSLIADTVKKIVTARKPHTRYVVGFGGKPLVILRRILPDRAFDYVVSIVFGVRR